MSLVKKPFLPHMEQKNIKNSYDNSNSNCSCNNSRDEDGFVVVPVHSQVMKIKQEFEKIKHPSLQQLEIRGVICKVTRDRERSRSPLGLAERPISVGN